MGGKIFINDSGTWRDVKKFQINDSGTWREIKKGWVNDSGTWRQIYAGVQEAVASTDFIVGLYKVSPGTANEAVWYGYESLLWGFGRFGTNMRTGNSAMSFARHNNGTNDFVGFCGAVSGIDTDSPTSTFGSVTSNSFTDTGGGSATLTTLAAGVLTGQVNGNAVIEWDPAGSYAWPCESMQFIYSGTRYVSRNVAASGGAGNYFQNTSQLVIRNDTGAYSDLYTILPSSGSLTYELYKSPYFTDNHGNNTRLHAVQWRTGTGTSSGQNNQIYIVLDDKLSPASLSADRFTSVTINGIDIEASSFTYSTASIFNVTEYTYTYPTSVTTAFGTESDSISISINTDP